MCPQRNYHGWYAGDARKGRGVGVGVEPEDPAC